ncbi:MAG: transcriptional repressor [Synergistaceae bacterium]|nr:transcriptional repressor [Synergistaceae bacterium]
MTEKRYLKEVGLRATKARLTTLKLLYERGRPLSHGEIQEGLGEGLDRVTLYRTLASLERAGLVHRVQGTDGAWRFCAHRPDQAGCPGNHPHFLCLQCGAMVCLTGQPLPHVDVPPGCSVSGKQLVVYGLCPSCREREKEGREKARSGLRKGR